MEAIATRLEAIATRLEAIAIRLDFIGFLGLIPLDVENVHTEHCTSTRASQEPNESRKDRQDWHVTCPTTLD